MSSLLDYDFDTEYSLSLSAWSDGTLAECELLDFQKPDAIINEYINSPKPGKYRYWGIKYYYKS